MADKGTSTSPEDTIKQLEMGIAKLRELRQNATFPVEYHVVVDECLDGLDVVRSGLAWIPSDKTADVLQQREQEFKALVENAPDMIARFDREHRYLYVNPVIEKMTGAAPAVFLGKTNHELGVPKELADLWQRQLAQVVETGREGEFRFEGASPEDERFFHVRLAPEFDPDGAVMSILAIIRDVTDSEQARRTLQRYASRLHLLNRINKALRAAYTVEEIAESILPYAQQLLNCSRASVALFDNDMRQAHLLAVYSGRGTVLGKGARLPMERNWVLEELAQGKISTIQDLSSFPSGNGEPQTLRDEDVSAMICVPLIAQGKLIGSLNLGMPSFTPLTPGQQEVAREMGDLLAIAIYQADLHQQVREHAEMLERNVAKRTAALKASETRFRTMFESAPMGIALVDIKGRVLSSNPALQQMLGYSARELKGMKVDHFIHPDYVGKRNAFFQELIEGQRDRFRMEKRYIRKDGSTIWVRPTVALIRNPLGADRYAIKLVDDITEEKRMREALVQAERLNVAGRLGASLAHEISNPLQAVIGSLGLAAEMLEPDADVAIFIEIAIEELERAADIVAQLRDLNRRSQPQEKQLTQLNEIVTKVLLLNRKLCDTKGIEVVWTPQADLPEISVVSARIRQVLLNLVLNAINAMPTGGSLQVSTAWTLQPDGVRIVFADSGTGIDPELLPHLFEPFRSTRSQGMGLGLYISKSIVEEHGGRLEAENHAGQGATFTVWLPRQESHEDGRQA